MTAPHVLAEIRDGHRMRALIREAIASLAEAEKLLSEAGELAALLDTPHAFERTNQYRVAHYELPTLIPRLVERLSHFAPTAVPEDAAEGVHSDGYPASGGAS